ncbi:MAG: PEP/pyruvate-binding domain-containing protein [Christensenellaceae bacterium]
MNNLPEFKEAMERAKELECLYLVEEALNAASLTDALMEVSKVVPLGFSDFNNCTVTVIVDDERFDATPVPFDTITLAVDINVKDKLRGKIIASYPTQNKDGTQSQFLPQEEKLLKSIARKIADVILQKSLVPAEEYAEHNWREIIRLLQSSNHQLLLHVCEKMLSLFAVNQPQKIEAILAEFGWAGANYCGEVNIPLESTPKMDVVSFSNSVFKCAQINFSDAVIYENINRWIYQFKMYEMIKMIHKPDSDINSISANLKRYLSAINSNTTFMSTTNRWLLVELIRRFLTEQPDRVENIRQYADVESFCDLLDCILSTPSSGGRIGGKATGIFLASQIIKKYTADHPDFKEIKFPKTWYIPVDEFDKLINDNNLEELNEHKYREISEARILYPQIIQTLKNSKISPYMLNNLSYILDQCHDKPLIVRSSSLLEDQIGSAFSGKYKSLFIPYIKDKQERLKHLVDSILEVYASIYNPDAIQYRKERNLLDSSEQMGIIIQEVVGHQVGKYYFPLYSGVAFSNNEFRWSPRIKREDGLIRIVMGLGTRAVDRLKDDYPLLISPGQPQLTLNRIPEEMQKYSSRYIDVIDVESNEFLTLPIEQLIREYGDQIPQLHHVVSILNDDLIKDFNPITTNFKTDHFVVTFEGLIKKTAVIKQLNTLLTILKEALGFPVDIEFACDGEHIYILQCRPQSKGDSKDPPAIPSDIEQKTKVFTSKKYVSNGKVTGIKTIVYVDPEGYVALDSYQKMMDVGSAVSELNKVLAKKSFILMGPGRWGSRGDIKLGVPVTYSDICNTAMLLEIANEKAMLHPELSFGTHFFQDLVESGIHYLPLYPEDKSTFFNSPFFHNSRNFLGEILPDYSYLSDVVKVINVEQSYHGSNLVVRMNADLEIAVAYLDMPNTEKEYPYSEASESENNADGTQEWKWRHYMAEKIAASMDFEDYGIKAIYLIGSTNSCSARLNSDIDLLIHIDTTAEQQRRLTEHLNGWSFALAEINFLKTGYHCDGLLDIHYVTNQDIANKDSFAIKINSVYDPPLLLKKRS